MLRASLRAPDGRACAAAGGACWAFIGDWFRFILFGRFPYAEQWRPAIVLAIFVALLLASFSRTLPGRRLALAWAVGARRGGAADAGRRPRPALCRDRAVERTAADPDPGGRRARRQLSAGPAAGARPALAAAGGAGVCIFYIEAVRGVPFIAWLFLMLVLLPLFLPPGVVIAKLWRAEIAFALFIAAYLAEVVRGGLQAIPRGQYEAADALGLGYLHKTRAHHPAAGARHHHPGRRSIPSSAPSRTRR